MRRLTGKKNSNPKLHTMLRWCSWASLTRQKLLKSSKTVCGFFLLFFQTTEGANESQICKMPGSKETVKGVQESASDCARPLPVHQASGERSVEGTARPEAVSSQHRASDGRRQGRGGRSVVVIRDVPCRPASRHLIFGHLPLCFTCSFCPKAQLLGASK